MPRGYVGRFVSGAESTRRWRELHPEQATALELRRPKRPYDPEKSKAWRARRLQQPNYRINQNLKANERAKAIRRWLDVYKLERGCIDCGYKMHPAALHFDHVRGSKLINVCNAKSIEQAQQEIGKCEIRCANCHAIETFKRLQHPCKPSVFEKTYERASDEAEE